MTLFKKKKQTKVLGRFFKSFQNVALLPVEEAETRLLPTNTVVGMKTANPKRRITVHTLN